LKIKREVASNKSFETQPYLGEKNAFYHSSTMVDYALQWLIEINYLSFAVLYLFG